MKIKADKASWSNSDGTVIEVQFSEAPRRVPRTETGPARDGFKVRGVARFVSGPCFDRYGAHATDIDLGLTAAEVLAWEMARAS